MKPPQETSRDYKAPAFLTRDAKGRLHCDLCGSARCEHVRAARKSGVPFRTVKA